MRIFPWIMYEIRFRLRMSLLILMMPLSVVMVWTVTGYLLDSAQKEAATMFAEKEQKLEEQMRYMWNEYRVMTKDLGFNVLILPKNQNLADFYSEQFASRYMPESYADSLANSGNVTIQHILPALFHRTWWPEQKRTILACGVRGEVSRALFPAANKKSPIMQPVSEGSVVCGYELANQMELGEGDQIVLHGKTFTVEKCHDRRGNQDDITMWLPLAEAQQMFDKPKKINAILALECRCATDEALPNLAKIRKSLETQLPETQVIEFMSEVITRAEARFAAVETEKEALSKERRESESRMRERKQFAALVLFVLSLMAMGFTGFLMLLNVRSRIYELGIFRAVGFQSGDLLYLLLGKVVLLGLIGTICGIACGHGITTILHPKLFESAPLPQFMGGNVLLAAAVTVAGTLLTTLAGLFPILKGLRREPAEILRRMS